jgi:hypothetical protein
MKPSPHAEAASRRAFLKTSAIGAAALTTALAHRSPAAEDGTIDVALIGAGGRGTGAVANALSAPRA